MSLKRNDIAPLKLEKSAVTMRRFSRPACRSMVLLSPPTSRVMSQAGVVSTLEVHRRLHYSRLCFLLWITASANRTAGGAAQ
ncbi:unnamed protein product [Pleuronectes platessa]|uniref:Uncharacterized protein n=1 Tax=Pleuronectes platessa TaxID=8262 RepID=A0A9N7Z3D7_PLEPL|nr:unnamed protein product [Pleuronectes platessa]